MTESDLLAASPELSSRPLARRVLLTDIVTRKTYLRFLRDLENATLIPDPSVAAFVVDLLWRHHKPKFMALKAPLSQTIDGYEPWSELLGAAKNVVKNMRVRARFPDVECRSKIFDKPCRRQDICRLTR